MKRLSIVTLFLMLVLVLVPTNGQSSRTGSISGVIVDPNNARITTALIRVENEDYHQTISSDSEGKFELDLPVGTYRVTVESPGFRTYVLASLRISSNVRRHTVVLLKVKEPDMPRKIAPSRSIHAD